MELHSRTRNRLQLLANGYSPLPNKNKICTLKGWPRVEIDRDFILRHNRSSAYPATGVRLDGPLIFIDADIPVPELADGVRRAMLAAVPKLQSAPERIGRAPKFGLFAAYVDRPIAIWRSLRYMLADDAEEVCFVEIFGSAAPRQIGAFGPHSEGLDYSWTGHSLLDIKRDDLPELGKDDVKALLKAANRVLHKAGLKEAPRGGSGLLQPRDVYDLTPAMRFDTNLHGVVSLEQLGRLAQRGAKLRCSASFWDPLGKRTDRCLVGWSPGGYVTVHDTFDHRTHRPAQPPVDDMLTEALTQAAALGFIREGD